jgi:leader peptidase (prepilin peptidase) / N-methyltransferase
MKWPIDPFCCVLIAASPAVGSFIAAAVERIQHHRPIAFGRSQCGSCGTPLWPRDLIPLISYLALGGRCRFCAIPIPCELFAVEAIALGLVVAIQLFVSPDQKFVGTLLTWLLLALSWYDCRYGRLPDVLTVPLGASGILVALLRSPAPASYLLGGVGGLLVPATIAYAYKLLRGRDGLGGGDIKLLGAMGAWVGWQELSLLVLLAALSAVAFCVARGRIAATAPVRFGPFIAAAGWFLWICFPTGAPA